MNIKNSVFTAATTFLIIIGAYLSIQIGPVPVVLTNFFIILAALIFGWRIALISVVSYLILGAVGLPVFSGGKAGLGNLLGLTGGFLFAFLPLAAISGFGRNKNIAVKLILAISGSILVYLIGVPWAMTFYNNVVAANGDKPLWDLATTLKYTTTPFLIPDLIKIVIAIVISETLKPLVNNLVESKENN